MHYSVTYWYSSFIHFHFFHLFNTYHLCISGFINIMWKKCADFVIYHKHLTNSGKVKFYYFSFLNTSINPVHTSHTILSYCVYCSFMSDSLRPHGLQPTRLFCPQDSPGKNTAVGCHFLLHDIQLQMKPKSILASSFPKLFIAQLKHMHY